MGKTAQKMQSVGQQNNFFSSPFLGSIFCKEKIFFTLNKEQKPVIVSVQPIYTLCNKIEEHSWIIKRNSNQIIFVLLCNNLGFSVF